METALLVRGRDLDLLRAGLRLLGIPHRASRSTAGQHRVVVAEEDAVPAQVVLARLQRSR